MTATTMLVLAMLAVVTAGYFGLRAWARRMVQHRNLTRTKLLRLLELLLDQGFDGGILFVDSDDRVRFLQVQKYIEGDQVGLRLDFPRAQWSEPFFDEVREFLRAHGVLSEETRTLGLGTRAFITADFGRNLTLAQDVIRGLATTVLGIDLERRAVARFGRSPAGNQNFPQANSIQ